MLISLLLIGVVLLVIVLPFVYKPLRGSRRVSNLAPVAPASNATPSRVDLLIALRDLDFDHSTGKLSDADYAALRGRLLKQIADLSADADSNEHLDAEIEAAIQQRRRLKKKGAKRCRECGAALQPRDRFCPACGVPVAETRVCDDCGRPYDALDAFCAHCGASLPQMVEAMS